MAYVALYRKWRPGTFRDLVGQEHISRTLSHAILANRIGHAYLFSGPRGTGKTSTAKIFAKALNCEQGPTPEPCGVCENCRKINEGSSMDVFEIDAASNRGIDEIRDLRETVKFAPADGRYKVYIIDEVHMLTTEAFNALLKTLEEPPSHVVFILATTEAHKVPATIQSRCQRYDFRRITTDEIVARLEYVAGEMKIEAEREALMLIALQADGGLRDALSILDQCASVEEGCVTADRVRQILGLVGHQWIDKMTRAVSGHRAQEILEMLAGLLRDGKDLKQVLSELSLHLRSLMIYQAAGNLNQMSAYAEAEDTLKEQAGYFSQEELMQMIHRLHEAMAELRWSPQPRITVEIALLSICRGDMERPQSKETDKPAPAADDARIARLEAKLAEMAASLASGKAAASALPKEKTPIAPKKPVVPKTAPSTNLPMTEHPEGKAVWKEVLSAIQHNVPMYSCVKSGKCVGMTGNRFFLRFPGPIMSNIVMRMYKKKVEEELERVTGNSLQLVCDAENAAPRMPVELPKPKASPETAASRREMDSVMELPPEAQENVRHAVDILDGELVTPPSDEDMYIPPPTDEDAPPDVEE